jgi:hypothetical protein
LRHTYARGPVAYDDDGRRRFGRLRLGGCVPLTQCPMSVVMRLHWNGNHDPSCSPMSAGPRRCVPAASGAVAEFMRIASSKKKPDSADLRASGRRCPFASCLCRSPSLVAAPGDVSSKPYAIV